MQQRPNYITGYEFDRLQKCSLADRQLHVFISWEHPNDINRVIFSDLTDNIHWRPVELLDVKWMDWTSPKLDIMQFYAQLVTDSISLEPSWILHARVCGWRRPELWMDIFGIHADQYKAPSLQCILNIYMGATQCSCYPPVCENWGIIPLSICDHHPRRLKSAAYRVKSGDLALQHLVIRFVPTVVFSRL